MNASKEILASETGSKENFIQIGVYFQSFNTKLIYEEPKYQVSNRIIHELVIIRHKKNDIEEYEIRYYVQLTKIVFQIGNMLSALGGSLSLYLGISVSMMFEVLELLVDILTALFSFCAASNYRGTGMNV